MPIISTIGQEFWDGTALPFASSATAIVTDRGNLEFTSSGVDKRRCVAATGWVQAGEAVVSSEGATCVVPACGEALEPKGYSWVGLGEDFRLSARRARRFHKLPRREAVRDTEAVGVISII